MTESQEQKIIVAWFREAYPDYRHVLRVSMNGLNFGSGKRAAILINFIRSMGIEIGESDLCFVVARGPYHALIIEHKADGQPHKASEAQKEYLQRHNATGNLAVVTRGIEEAKQVISDYMEL